MAVKTTIPAWPHRPLDPHQLHSTLYSVSAGMCDEVKEEINPQPPGQPLPQATLSEASLLLSEAPLVHRLGHRSLGARAPATALSGAALPCKEMSLPYSQGHQSQVKGRRAPGAQPGGQGGARSLGGEAERPGKGRTSRGRLQSGHTDQPASRIPAWAVRAAATHP